MFVIVYGYNHILANKTNRIKKLAILGLIFITWLGYNFAIAQTGFLQNFSLPPRFPLLLILPAFTFIGIILYQDRKNQILDSTPQSWPIFYQSFRIIVEVLFFQSVLEGVLHEEVTFKGYNYDIIFASTAPIIGYLTYKKKVSDTVILVWNFLGLSVIASIIFLVTTTTYFPLIWGQTESLMNKEVMTFPYVLIASFLMPSAVFMHILSIIQIRRKNKNMN